MILKPAIASVSLGRASAGHGLIQKLEQAAQHRFEGVEIFYECLEDLACQLHGSPTRPALLEAATRVRECCDNNSLKVMVLQPFMFYDGLTDATEHQAKIEKLHFWFKLVKILGTDLIQIPTNFQEGGTTGDLDRITADLLEAAELGMKQSPVVRFAYEAVAWGNHLDTWDESWMMVQRVNRPNFGLCLDTFHIAGRVWGDPTVPSGQTQNANEALQQSLDKMSQEIDVSKIFYLQVGDAERLDPPLSHTHPLYVVGQKPRMTWSRNARLFAFEADKGGYLPVMDVVRTIVHGLKYEGWLSMELFHRSLFLKDSTIPAEYASRAAKSFQMVEKALKDAL